MFTDSVVYYSFYTTVFRQLKYTNKNSSKTNKSHCYTNLINKPIPP